MVDLNSLISPYDPLKDVVQLQYAYGISPDGRHIVGQALVDGNLQAYQISAVPLPAAVWVFGAALGGLGYFVRRRKKLQG